MAMDLDLDSELLDEAMRLSGHRTGRAVVDDALREQVGRRSQRRTLEPFGTIDDDENHACKEQRSRR